MDYTRAINEMDALPLSISAHRLPMPRSNRADLVAENIKPSSAAAAVTLPKNITPELPAHPSSSCRETTGAAASDGGCDKHQQLPPTFAYFFGSKISSQVNAAASVKPSSLKKNAAVFGHDQKTEHLSPGEDSTYESPSRSIPSIISTRLEPSSHLMMSPMLGGMSSGKSPNKKRSMEGRSEFSSRSEDEQPHTPKYRCLLQGLSLNSPARSSTSTSPEETSGSVQQSPYRRPPNIPSFVKKKLDSITLTDSFESQSFSAANTPIRTPETGQFFSRSSSEKVSTPTTASSSFHSLRSNRTSIGHQNSPFKMLPPRLGDQSQGSSNDPPSPFVSSPTKFASSSPYASSPTRYAASSPYASSPTRYASSSPLMTSSPSPRVVPLKILSRDGSPVESVKVASHAGDIPKLEVMMSSPLMRSLDHFAKNDSMEEIAQGDDDEEGKLSGAAMPSMCGKSPKSTMYNRSPKSSNDYPQLPRIKLTPRSKSNYASLMLDASPRGEATPPCLNLLASSGSALKRKESSGDKEAAEMDSLLSGFGHHNADDDEARNVKPSRSDDLLGRVESEESEMVAIARTPLLLPSFSSQAKGQKPMKSITFKTPDREESLGSPSFLPRFVPATKSRSLFNSPRVDDPIEQIIRADAIAEAAKSNEELTDDESDSEGPGSVFLLCSPKAHASKMLHKMEKRPTRAAIKPLKPSYRADSPSFGRSRSCSIGSKKRTRSFSTPTTPTIAEEGLTSFDAMFSKSTTSNECTQQGFSQKDESAATYSSFGSLFEYDDTPTSHHQSHSMPTSIDIGMKTTGLSMSSLCGLDIVDESVDELRDKVPESLPFESSQTFKQLETSDMGVVGLRRSELSQNSLGLSVDSVGDADQRDLFTPPVTAVRSLQSPPPLPKRNVNYQFL